MAKKKVSKKATKKQATQKKPAAKAKPGRAGKKASKKTPQKAAKKATGKTTKPAAKASSKKPASRVGKPKILLDQDGQPPRGFVMGDHQFFDPAQNGSLDRYDLPPRQILGAPPPTCYAGIARESLENSPVNRLIRKGEWCGHAEPTFTAFDIVIDGHEEVEVSAILEPQPETDSEGDDDDDSGDGQLPQLIAARAPGGAWHALFRHAWTQGQNALREVAGTGCTPEESAQLDEATDLVRAAVGFEYPCDAQSPDDASWMILDFLLKGEKKVVTVVHDELA